MAQKQEKTPEEQVDEFFKEMKGIWKGTKEDVDWMRAEVLRQFKDNVGDPARDNINYSTHYGHQFYKAVENVVGRDRMIAAGLLSVKGGWLGLWGGPKGSLLGMFLGAGAGLIIGRPATNWLKGGKQYSDGETPPPSDKAEPPPPKKRPDRDIRPFNIGA